MDKKKVLLNKKYIAVIMAKLSVRKDLQWGK